MRSLVALFLVLLWASSAYAGGASGVTGTYSGTLCATASEEGVFSECPESARKPFTIRIVRRRGKLRAQWLDGNGKALYSFKTVRLASDAVSYLGQIDSSLCTQCFEHVTISQIYKRNAFVTYADYEYSVRPGLQTQSFVSAAGWVTRTPE